MGDKLSLIIIPVVIFVLAVVAFTFFSYDVTGTTDLSENLENAGVIDEPEHSYNITIPEDVIFESGEMLNTDDKIRIEEHKNPNNKFSLYIEKINTDVVVDHTNNLKVFDEKGWLMLPWSYQSKVSIFSFLPINEKKGDLEAIILCERKYYGPSHEKSCYDIDLLAKGDEIEFNSSIYKVKSIAIVPKKQKAIFEPSDDSNILKIITTTGSTPTDVNRVENYLVIIASQDN